VLYLESDELVGRRLSFGLASLHTIIKHASRTVVLLRLLFVHAVKWVKRLHHP
jgi:hypothetical protein